MLKINPLRIWINDNRWIHTGIGLFGNGAFFIGSIFFLWESLKTAGIWLFIIGAAGMLIGNIGDALAMDIEQDHHSRY